MASSKSHSSASTQSFAKEVAADTCRIVLESVWLQGTSAAARCALALLYLPQIVTNPINRAIGRQQTNHSPRRP